MGCQNLNSDKDCICGNLLNLKDLIYWVEKNEDSLTVGTVTPIFWTNLDEGKSYRCHIAKKLHKEGHTPNLWLLKYKLRDAFPFSIIFGVLWAVTKSQLQFSLLIFWLLDDLWKDTFV